MHSHPTAATRGRRIVQTLHVHTIQQALGANIRGILVPSICGGRLTILIASLVTARFCAFQGCSAY